MTVKCPDGFINQGSETITCQNEIHYKFDVRPRCEATGIKIKLSSYMKQSRLKGRTCEKSVIVINETTIL